MTLVLIICIVNAVGGMLLQATLLVDLIAMAITLWLAFYLFARGFPSRITLRAVILLLVLSVFFYGAYNNIFHQVVGTAAWRAVMLVIGLASWYSLTYQIMSVHSQKQLRWLEISIYILAVITAALLLLPNSFMDERGNALFVAHMRIGGSTAGKPRPGHRPARRDLR